MLTGLLSAFLTIIVPPTTGCASIYGAQEYEEGKKFVTKSVNNAPRATTPKVSGMLEAVVFH